MQSVATLRGCAAYFAELAAQAASHDDQEGSEYWAAQAAALRATADARQHAIVKLTKAIDSDRYGVERNMRITWAANALRKAGLTEWAEQLDEIDPFCDGPMPRMLAELEND